VKRGLGKGKGFETVREYSLIEEDSDPELLNKISDRVAELYDMLYEDEGNNIINKDHFGIEDDEEDEDINDLDEDIVE